MRIIIVRTGTVGSAVGKVLKELGHEVISVGRKSGDQQASCIFHGLYAGAGAEVVRLFSRYFAPDYRAHSETPQNWELKYNQTA